MASINDPTARILSFYREAFRDEHVTDPLAQIPLQLHGVAGDRATCATSPFQLLREALQERGVIGQIVDNGDRLAAASFLFQTQLRHDPVGDGVLLAPLAAAFTVLDRPSTAWTHLADPGGIHDAPVAH